MLTSSMLHVILLKQAFFVWARDVFGLKEIIHIASGYGGYQNNLPALKNNFEVMKLVCIITHVIRFP